MPTFRENLDLDNTDLFRGTLVVLSALSFGVFIITQAVSDPKSESATGLTTSASESSDSSSSESSSVQALNPRSPSVSQTPSSLLRTTAAAVATPSTKMQTSSTSKVSATAQKTSSTLKKASSSVTANRTQTTKNPSFGVGSAATALEGKTEVSSSQKARSKTAYNVTVFNAARVGGVAGKVNNELHAKKFSMTVPSNANTVIDTSVILYAPGYEAEAKEVAVGLGVSGNFVQSLTSSNQPVQDLGSTNVFVLVGRDGKFL